MNGVFIITAIVLVAGCSTAKSPSSLSYEEKVKRAEAALEGGKIFEARKWAREVLATEPERFETQRLMARVLDREYVQTKILNTNTFPETLSNPEKSLQVKTWLERSRSYLELEQYEEARQAAGEVFRLDPQNVQASRLMDKINLTARERGGEDQAFLDRLYQEEMEARMRRYAQEAELGIREKRWGAAEFAIEKLLLLDPQNADGHRLLAVLEEQRSN